MDSDALGGQGGRVVGAQAVGVAEALGNAARARVQQLVHGGVGQRAGLAAGGEVHEDGLVVA